MPYDMWAVCTFYSKAKALPLTALDFFHTNRSYYVFYELQITRAHLTGQAALARKTIFLANPTAVCQDDWWFVADRAMGS